MADSANMWDLRTVLPLMVAVCPFLYLVLLGLYNVFLHPLKHYPGPFLMRASRIPHMCDKICGRSVHETRKLHDIYGDVVRIAPNQLSYISSQAWTDIYGFGVSEQKGNFQKDPWFYVKPPSGVDSLLSSNEMDHRRMRRLQAHAFSEKALSMQEPLLVRYVDLFISRLRDQQVEKNGIVDLVAWYNFATFDILGELAFGDSFKCLERGVMHPWISNQYLGLKEVLFMRERQLLPIILQGLFSKFVIPKNILTSRAEVFGFAASKARQRLQQGTDRPDFMSHILRHNDEKGMTHVEIEVGSSLLITAGSETTATLLSGLTYYLLCNRPILVELTSIIRTTFPTDDSITLLALQQIDFLLAVLQEGLRMYPPVADTLLRITPPSGGMVNGQFVPPNTKVGVNQWSANLSERKFAQPMKFAPERWMKNAPKEFQNDDKKVMQPFSVGPRNCIGKNLAYAEMRMILARLLWHFDLELQPESRGWLSQKNFVFWEKGSLNVKLTPRGT